ncbi:24825_t:CDS:2 [Gigaspora margarita]|uniref:24825_t:CDS:1 n=1 Tax=Gigaspora margarita TaxID=4874 RepID=A0ABN7UX18_GIGMA|nr:24825_t:CDS:2 [Gigaspora margarita]
MKIDISQKESKTCLLYNKPKPLFEPNGANLELITILTCLHSFHLRYNNNIQIFLKEEEYLVKKLFKYLPKEPQNFSPTSKSMGIENSITSEMIFIKLYDKIVQAKKILEKKT